MSSASTASPYTSPARWGAMAAEVVPASSATRRAASAVELAARSSACGNCARTYAWHCAVATGIDSTVFTSAREVPGLASRQCSMSSTTSRWINKSWLNASSSCVRLTIPSMEFSIATNPKSTSPASTASSTSGIVRYSRCSATARSGCDFKACSVNVPSGPRKPIFVDGSITCHRLFTGPRRTCRNTLLAVRGADEGEGSLFERVDEGLVLPTELARGPWNPGALHGGPVAAVIAQAVEEVIDDGVDWFVARLTVDIERPVPLEPLAIDTVVSRPGRKVSIVDATVTLAATGMVLARARALRIRSANIAMPYEDPLVGPWLQREPAPQGPEHGAHHDITSTIDYVAFHADAVEH